MIFKTDIRDSADIVIVPEMQWDVEVTEGTASGVTFVLSVESVRTNGGANLLEEDPHSIGFQIGQAIADKILSGPNAERKMWAETAQAIRKNAWDYPGLQWRKQYDEALEDAAHYERLAREAA